MPRAADGGLSAREKSFVREYLVDLSPAAAARRSGYSERCAKETGYQLLRKPTVAAEIQKAMDDRAKRTEITADYVLTTIRETVDRVKEPGDAFEPMAVFRGCELLGKHLRLFTDKMELSGKVATPVELSDEQLAAIAAAGRG